MEEDDDFGEFGGFEAADPVVDGGGDTAEGNSAQAAPSPWVVYATSGSLGSQPDLIQQQQNTSPVPASLPEITGLAGASGINHEPSNEQTDPSIPTFSADFNAFSPSAIGGARSITEQVLEPDFSRSSRPPVPIPDGVLDLDLSHRAAAAAVVCDEEVEVQAAAGYDASQEIPHEAEEAQRDEGEREVNQPAADDEQSVSDRIQMEKVLASLEGEHRALQLQLAEAHHSLEEQQALYQQSQERHARELQEMRKAGHDALAVMVEEYKELSLVAVREERERCTALLKDALSQERQTLASSLRSQQDLLNKELKEKQNNMDAILQEKLQEQASIHEERMKEVTEEESRRNEDRIKAAVTEERERGERILREALEAERIKSNQNLQEETKKMAEEVVKLREENRQAVEEITQNERQQSKVAVEEAVREERDRSETLMREMMKQARDDMKSHLDEEKQADKAVRQRSLAAIDLFLDAARQQINLLMSPKDDQAPS